MRIGQFEIRRRARSIRDIRVLRANDASLTFTCNICGSVQTANADRFDRESVTCEACDSNVRFRSIAHLLTEHFLGESSVLSQVCPMRHIKGIGLSDWPGYAAVLGEKFDYLNTYFDRAPRLDITAPDEAFTGSCDFVISSDVFEHVLPPVGRAFEGAHQLLKPGGILVLTVPYNPGVQCMEHFPRATGYKPGRESGSVEIQHPDGNFFAASPVFHGGAGATLEMRAMSEGGVLDALHAAGFDQIRVRGDALLRFGIVHQSTVSLPITARKPAV